MLNLFCYNKNMKKDFLDICKFLDTNNFSTASKKELYDSLQDLCDYFSIKEGRRKITLKYDNYKLKTKTLLNSTNQGSMLGLSFIDSIYLMPNDEITSYQSYLALFDTIIHESYHQFEYYFLNLPKCFSDDIMWDRILKYNYYFISQGDCNIKDFMKKHNLAKNEAEYLLYRFNKFELDAYKATDFLLNKICKAMKKSGANINGLQNYINSQRKSFSKELKMLNKLLKENAMQKIDEAFKTNALRSIKQTEELNISLKKLENMCENGEYLYQITNNNECALISQKFINNALKSFKFFLPHLYSKNNEIFKVEKEF